MAGWADLLRETGPTRFPSPGAPSRIDRALANSRAREWIIGAELRWDLGIATHAAMQIDFRPQAPEAVWLSTARPSLEGEARADWEEQRDGVTADVCREWGHA
eukprot:5538772-Lingulodinium_polyedra.AAC.1